MPATAPGLLLATGAGLPPCTSRLLAQHEIAFYREHCLSLLLARSNVTAVMDRNLRGSSSARKRERTPERQRLGKGGRLCDRRQRAVACMDACDATGRLLGGDESFSSLKRCGLVKGAGQRLVKRAAGSCKQLQTRLKRPAAAAQQEPSVREGAAPAGARRVLSGEDIRIWISVCFLRGSSHWMQRGLARRRGRGGGRGAGHPA